MATNYKIADRLNELKIELAKRKKAGSPNFIRKPKEEAETVEEHTIQSSPYHDWLHAQVADLAENGIRVSAEAETVTLQGPDGTLLAQGVVPEPDYNDPARSDPFDTFLNSGALRYLQTLLESLGCAPQPISGPPAVLRGTFKGRTVIGRLELLDHCGRFRLDLDLTDGTFQICRHYIFKSWPPEKDIASLLEALELDLTMLLKSANFLASRTIGILASHDMIKFNGCSVTFQDGSLLVKYPDGLQREADWQKPIDTISLTREFLASLKAPPAAPASPSPSMQSDFELA